MITFSSFGNHGRLGNQLFQLAAMCGWSDKHNAEVFMPPWQYAVYFQSQFQTTPPRPVEKTYVVKEGPFHYVPRWFDQYGDLMSHPNKVVDIVAWAQTEKYWDHCISAVKSMLTFNKEIEHGIMQPWLHVFNKPTIAISIRRGDYVDNPNYDLLPIEYYIGALLEQFPDFREVYNIIVFSDDINYCKVHFQCLPNVFFAENMGPMEQLILGSHCQHAIIANSTFSWWMARFIEFRDENSDHKIIRPGYLFAGELLKTSDDRDHWPDRWYRYDHKNNFINLSEVTFTIPISRDSKDREENLMMCIEHLQKFKCSIILGEHGHTAHFEDFAHKNDIEYMRFEFKEFHRTRMLNEMAVASKTEIIANWDADIIVPPMQIVEAAHMLMKNMCSVAYPYNGYFARVPRNSWYQPIMKYKDAGIFGAFEFNGMKQGSALSVGGAIMWNLEAFVDAGMENENFVSYAPEDSERYERANKLGFKVSRVKGVLYHLDHQITYNSGVGHRYYSDNMSEYIKVQNMDAVQLKEYVSTWPWKKRYLPLYYESITEESIRSRNAIFPHIEGIVQVKSILDLGAGLGAWGSKLSEIEYMKDVEYVGVDFGVPTDQLIMEGKYIDHDLRKPLDLERKFDLVLSMEVCEHLEEEYADTIIDTICRHGDLILFSAAIKGQGGRNHYNEQPQSYWVNKFHERGFTHWADDIRVPVWDDNRVGVWFRQNMILFARDERAGFRPKHYIFDLVHPEMFRNHIQSKIRK